MTLKGRSLLLLATVVIRRLRFRLTMLSRLQ